MRDQIFSGRDLAEALGAASLALGAPAESLLYVVMDGGRQQGPGPPPVRIAVLGDATPPPHAGRAQARHHGPPGVGAILSALAEVAGLELTAEAREGEGVIEVRLGGPGTRLFVEDGGEALPALEHILRKALHQQGDDRRLVLTCEGYRERRDAALQELAQNLAGAVLCDGRTRHTVPLNSYERRIVHLALSDVAGVRTLSVGERSDRRVAVIREGAP